MDRYNLARTTITGQVATMLDALDTNNADLGEIGAHIAEAIAAGADQAGLYGTEITALLSSISLTVSDDESAP